MNLPSLHDAHAIYSEAASMVMYGDYQTYYGWQERVWLAASKAAIAAFGCDDADSVRDVPVEELDLLMYDAQDAAAAAGYAAWDAYMAEMADERAGYCSRADWKPEVADA